jgi:hypothetical protein
MANATRRHTLLKMPSHFTHALVRWVGAASVAALGLVVFLLFAPDASRLDSGGPVDDPRVLAPVVTAVVAPGTELRGTKR